MISKINPRQKAATQEQLRKVPELYAQDGLGWDAKVFIKYFNRGLTWFVTELDQEQGLAFGYVLNHMDPRSSELGYISLEELSKVTNPMLWIERDLHFPVGEMTIREAVESAGYSSLTPQEEESLEEQIFNS